VGPHEGILTRQSPAQPEIRLSKQKSSSPRLVVKCGPDSTQHFKVAEVDSPESERDRWFAEEVQAHESSLRAVLRRSVTSLSDVDDLIQESFIRVLRAREKKPIEKSKSFLFAVARNAMRDLMRRRAVAGEISVTETVSMGVLDDKPGVVDLVIRQQELDLLAEAVRSLPERCRQVFLLRKIQNLSQREIASRLSISENTVETLVAKGARRCADYLLARGVGPNDDHGS